MTLSRYKLIAFRERASLTKSQMAEILLISPAKYGRIEAGERNASTADLKRFAEYFATTMDAAYTIFFDTDLAIPASPDTSESGDA